MPEAITKQGLLPHRSPVQPHAVPTHGLCTVYGEPRQHTPSGESIGGAQVACTDKEFALNELKVQPHGGMLEAMAGSVFCLIMPGNSQSSQRLTEAFIAGCIPVFLGPPWHTLPFSTEASLLS